MNSAAKEYHGDVFKCSCAGQFLYDADILQQAVAHMRVDVASYSGIVTMRASPRCNMQQDDERKDIACRAGWGEDGELEERSLYGQAQPEGRRSLRDRPAGRHSKPAAALQGHHQEEQPLPQPSSALIGDQSRSPASSLLHVKASGYDMHMLPL